MGLLLWRALRPPNCQGFIQSFERGIALPPTIMEADDRRGLEGDLEASGTTSMIVGKWVDASKERNSLNRAVVRRFEYVHDSCFFLLLFLGGFCGAICHSKKGGRESNKARCS